MLARVFQWKVQCIETFFEPSSSEGCPIHTNGFQWNGSNSIGIPLVRLVPMELHLVDRCSIGEMHIIT